MFKITVISSALLLVFAGLSANDNVSNTTLDIQPHVVPLAVKEPCNEGLGLILNNGSEWDIQYYSGMWSMLGWGWIEQDNVSHWTANDEIEVEFWSPKEEVDFLLLLKNVARNQKALATLKKAPASTHEACLTVVKFNRKTNCITLSDKSVWLHKGYDLYKGIFSSQAGEWLPGDPITLVKGEILLLGTDYFLWNHRLSEMPVVECISCP